jgi:hypothetical protein
VHRSDKDEIGAAGAQTTPVVIPRAATLEGFVAATAMGEVISLRDVEPLTTLIVVTRNSRYRIIVNCSTEVLIQGGQFFPDTTSVQLDGASFGGSFLKLGVIVVGLCMEIRAGHERIVTSPVRAVAEERPSTRN